MERMYPVFILIGTKGTDEQCVWFKCSVSPVQYKQGSREMNNKCVSCGCVNMKPLFTCVFCVARSWESIPVVSKKKINTNNGFEFAWLDVRVSVLRVLAGTIPLLAIMYQIKGDTDIGPNRMIMEVKPLSVISSIVVVSLCFMLPRLLAVFYFLFFSMCGRMLKTHRHLHSNSWALTKWMLCATDLGSSTLHFIAFEPCLLMLLFVFNMDELHNIAGTFSRPKKFAHFNHA